ncbi:MAG: Gfo/Idh/MocA family oxidoreductase [Chloroflexota bacterium]
MARRLNWGLLSTAKINAALIKPLNASNRTRLLAVASRSQSSAEAYAREWRIPRPYGSYEALLADPEIDVIYNSLPNHLHAEWTIRALRAGRHVLCEKPLALTLAEVDAMTRASHETGRVLMEAFMYRHHPQTLKVKELVEDDAVGELRFIRGSFTFTLDRPGNYRQIKEMGGGSIWDVGCYPISYARMIVGEEPLEVFGWQVKGPSGSDETFAGQMRFANNILFQFDSSFQSPFRASMEIVGADGILSIPEPFKPGRNESIYLRRGDKEEAVKIQGEELYRGEVENMVDVILNGSSPRVTLADSRGTIAAILGLLDSAETGSVVKLSALHES